MSAGKKSLLTAGRLPAGSVRRLAALSRRELAGALWARASRAAAGCCSTRDLVSKEPDPLAGRPPTPPTHPLEALQAFAIQELNPPAFWCFLKYSLTLPDAGEAFLALLPPGNCLSDL